MAFLLAQSFKSSLEKLNGEEQKAAKLAAFELQINPANPGLQCHRLCVRQGAAPTSRNGTGPAPHWQRLS
jgi:hypothetical protein